MDEKTGAVFWRENLRKGDHLDDPGVDGRILLKRIFNEWRARAGSIWIRMALVNAVINLRIP
jgi:hypothetical protein